MQFQGIGDLVVCVGKVILSSDRCMMYVCRYMYIAISISLDQG